MATINIRRDNKDPFYRYKMPPIVSKVEGRGNGIKTAVVNAADVARALSRPPAYVIKYFGSELGAQTSFNDETERYLVNGVHEASKLQDVLDGFISKFVLCGSCKNPETDIIVLKNGLLIRDCKACGQQTKLDPVHKLTTYIQKNPTSTKSKKKAAATASANVGGGAATGSLTTNGNGDESPTANGTPDEAAEAEADDDELTRRINAEASLLPETAPSEDTWTVDLSEEAVRARQRENERNLAALKLEEEDDVAQEVYEEFGNWVLDEKPDDVRIYERALELNIVTRHRTVQVLAQSLFDENIVEEKQIEKHAGLLCKLVDEVESREKAVLGGIERLVGATHPELLTVVSKILNELYIHDIVSKDTLLTWGGRVSKKYVDKETSKKIRKAAKPFLEFLATVDSDESSSEEESDDE